MRRLAGRGRAQGGGVLVEFALSALLLIVVILGLVDSALQMHARAMTERLAGRVAEAYASSRDLSLVDEVVASRTDVVLSQCLEPVALHLFDTSVGLEPLRDPGRLADGTAADAAAQAVRVEVVCRWPALLPFSPLSAATGGVFRAQVYAHIRVGALP